MTLAKRLTTLLLLAPLAALAADNWRDQGILYLDHSPQAVMHPVPVRAVTLGDGFWSERRKVNVERSLPTMLTLIEEHGAVDNFLRLEGKSKAPRKGPRYTDSDVYKWMEAVAFVLQSGDNPKLRADFDRLTGIILAAQEPSGYLNTFYQDDLKSARFKEMYRSHELYCLGHMLQAAIAYYRATGNRALMDGGIRYVDYLISISGPGKMPLLTGHPELEMSLVELYRTTNERRFLDFAAYLLSGVERDRLKLTEAQLVYMFSGRPFTERTQFEGHAVRAMYASSGATDYFLETGAPAYRKTLDTLWSDLIRHKMYITGGVGSRSEGEAFGDPYELPNAQAYTESCAAIGNVMWNFRMLAASGDAKYTDIMERALYNGINSGMSLNGTLYCYRNPLSSNGEKIRNEWYDTTCCPPNLERILASLPGYFYATAKDGIYAHFYHNSTLDWHLENGTPLQIKQTTNYPWTGDVTLTVTPGAETEFTLYARIPGWSKTTKVTVNGSPTASPTSGKYLAIRRHWKPGDRVQLHFDTTPRLIAANPQVTEDNGKVAVQRGPLVYCMEQIDEPAKVTDLLLSKPTAPFDSKFDPALLGGIAVLKHPGAEYRKSLEDEPLYEPLDKSESRATKPAELTLIPYYAWSNRERTPMEVWIPVLK